MPFVREFPHEPSGSRMERLPEAIVTLTWLRDAMAFVGVDYPNVRILDLPVCVHILAEVGARHRLVQLPLDQSLVSRLDDSISVGVPGEEAKGNVSIGLSV